LIKCKGFLIKQSWTILGLGPTIDWRDQENHPSIHDYLRTSLYTAWGLPASDKVHRISNKAVVDYFMSWPDDWLEGPRELTEPLSHGKLAPDRDLNLKLPHKKQGCQLFDYDVRYYQRSWLRNFPFNETGRRKDVRVSEGCGALWIAGSRNRWGPKRSHHTLASFCALSPRGTEGGSHSR